MVIEPESDILPAIYTIQQVEFKEVNPEEKTDLIMTSED